MEVYWVLIGVVFYRDVDFKEMSSCFLVDVEESRELSRVVY